MVALALLPSASLDAPTRAVPLALPAPSRHGATGFARTKIRPPRRAATAGLISRPALDAQLTAALATQRLVLMSAAAGYGKTAALAQWSDRLPDDTAVAWVSADEGDDLQRLLECLTAALEPCDLPWRQAPETLLAQAASAWPGARSGAAATLINALDACRAARGVIVFDNLHRVTDPDFFEFLDLMLERLGERWTIAIATRSDPPLALARLRVRGELAEFRLDALGFRRDDVRRLAADTVQADALFERTQGWPAGVRIALQGAAGGAPPAAADRVMFEFLAAEVIAPLDPALREFLLRTAVLRELTAERAAAVSGDPRAALRLDSIDRLGLFVTSLDAAAPTLRLHDLFRDALLHCLQRERPHEVRDLWQRAAAAESDPLPRAPGHESMIGRVGVHGEARLYLAAARPSEGRLDRAAPEPGPGLSPREQEVLARIAAGDSNKLIARAFDLSPHTVKRHVANILDKLDARTRGEAAAWFRCRRHAA